MSAHRFAAFASLSAQVLLAGCGSAPPPLARQMPLIAGGHAPREVRVCYIDLDSGVRIAFHGNDVMHAASTMKVAVMVELFRKADAGALDLDRTVPLRNQFRSIVDGSPYSLSADDDSDAELYAKVGAAVPIRALVERMIQRSSNLATNVLVELADPEDISQTLGSLGIARMKVLRGVEDTKAYRAGLSNVATANDLATLLAAIARHRAASPASCREMIAILEDQQFNTLIPAGLPPGTRVAHKTGMITRVRHDAAIVWPEAAPPYVLVVLTKGWDDPGQSAKVIANVARRVHALHVD